VKEKTNGEVSPFGNLRPVPRQGSIGPQPRPLVLLEVHVRSLKLGRNRLAELNVRPGTNLKIVLALGENLLFEMAAACQHALLVSVCPIIDRRAGRQNNQIVRFDEPKTIWPKAWVLVRMEWQIVDQLPKRVVEIDQGRGDFTESRTVPNLERAGLFPVTHGCRIREPMIVPHNLPRWIPPRKYYFPRAKDSTTKSVIPRQLSFRNEIALAKEFCFNSK
jgi:hypothetical protein